MLAANTSVAAPSDHPDTRVCPKPLVSVIAPVYDEQAVLPEFVQRLQRVASSLSDRCRFEFLLVDDGSRDQSLRVARELVLEDARIRVLELRRNYGQTAALQAGMDHAEGEIIITMDADLQHFPEEIPSFLDKIDEGMDVVCGWRHERREGILRRWPSRAANALIRAASGLTIHDIGTTFRAYRKEIVRDIRLLGENHRFIPVFAQKAGARIDEVKIGNIERPTGRSHYGLSRTLNVWLDLFFIYFYANYFDRPIRIFGKIAMLCLAAGFLIAAFLLGETVLTGLPVVYQRTGWLYLAAMLVLTGMQVLLTGVLAEVMARIYYSSPDHRSYKIRKSWGKDSLSD
jgi:glycosyltransferase involved in cell wall biosynthesis